MSNAFPVFAAMSAALAITAAGACSHPATSPATSSSHIVLHGFSEGNYAALEKNMGNKVCITGHLSIDSMGVYYSLQPAEKEDIIDLGFSRINTGLNRIVASRQGLRNGGAHTICGLLEDATPFKNCDTSHCKWYNLTDAKPQRRL